MSLGSTLNANDIKEGDDVYFECNIRANPKEHRISWFHNVSELWLRSSTSSVIINVNEPMHWAYSCSLTTVSFKVQHRSICLFQTLALRGEVSNNWRFWNNRHFYKEQSKIVRKGEPGKSLQLAYLHSLNKGSKIVFFKNRWKECLMFYDYPLLASHIAFLWRGGTYTGCCTVLLTGSLLAS